MPRPRDIRRLAMQVLYQLDQRGEADAAAIQESLADGPDPAAVAEAAFALAQAAWARRAEADALTTELAPDWPAYRQPPVDRAILRLAWFEIASGRAPVGLAINEAVDLAKEFAGEDSPAFINALLDKGAKQRSAAADASAPPEA